MYGNIRKARGHAVVPLVADCTTGRKVKGTISDDATGNFK